MHMQVLGGELLVTDSISQMLSIENSTKVKADGYISKINED